MMKTVSIKLVAALMMALTPLLMGATGHITYTATYDGNPTLGTRTLGGVTYTTVKYCGLFNTGEAGNPSLPVELIKFSVPYNATDFSVTATANLESTIVLDYPVLPIQSQPNQVTLPDNASYGSGTYPSTVAWYVDEGLLAGENHVVTVAVMPLVCDHSNGAVLYVNESVSLTLNYELSSTPSVHPIARKGASLRDDGYALVESLVVNPADARSNALSSAANNENFLKGIQRDTYTYVIITTLELKHSVRRIAALKKQKGIKVKVLTVQEALNDSIAAIYADPNAYYPLEDEVPVKMRDNLKAYYYDHGCEYVLLAGTNVPYLNYSGGQADMFFSELDADWFGLYDHGPAHYGELYVGRLLGNEAELIDNYTDKLFRYELNPGNGDYSYLRRALFSGCYQYDWVDEYFRELMTEACPDTVSIRERPNQNYPTGQDLLDSIGNNHYGFISFVNNAVPSHVLLYSGDETYDPHYLWALSEVKDFQDVVDNEINNGLNHMDNKHYPMIGYSQICNTMSYNCKEEFNLDVSFGQSFTMGKDYGGPAYIGMTYPCWNNNYNWYYDSFVFSNYLAENIPLSNGWLAQAILRSKASCEGTDWDVMNDCYNYLGDPALMMWTDLPEVYDNITIQRTDNSIIIAGLPANQSSIAFHSNVGATGKVTATSSTMTLNVSPNSTIMLYGKNRIPYIAPLVLQNTRLENSQYVIADEVIAGRSVDSGRTNGNVTVAEGIEYEIEASGTVTLSGGFQVERGAYFSVQKSTFK